MAGQYFFKTIDDNFLPLSGGTVSGNTYINANLSADTLNLVNTPNNDDSLTEILARNSTTGEIEYRDVQSIISAATSQDTYVTGSTLSGSTLILTRNDGVELTTDLSSLPITDLGKILFVSENGDDLTGMKGDVNKPWRNLYAAKSASTSGDTVYVFPGTWTYDNTTGTLPYNGQVDTLVNLWKNGVNYYFSTGTKVNILNQGGSGLAGGDRMYLFKPSGNVYETCNVYGQLEFFTDSTGPNTGGYALLFDTPLVEGVTTNEGYSCDLHIKSAASTSTQPIQTGGSSSGTTTSYFNLVADTVSCVWNNDGNSGSGAAIFVLADSSWVGTFKLNNLISRYHGFYNRSFINRGGTKINADIDCTMDSGEGAVIRNLNCLADSYYNIKKSQIGSIFYLVQGASSGTTTINGNIYNENGSSTSSIFQINSSLDNTTIFDGNIFPKLTSGIGRRIVLSTSDNNTTFFNSNIFYEGSVPTTQNMFDIREGVMNLKCNVEGSFANGLINNRNGNVVLSDCNFTSTVTGATLLSNDVTTTTGTTSIRNSTFTLDNSTTDLCDGQHLNTYILNSNIKNRGTSDIFTNSTNTGLLQIHNSTLVSNGGNTISISGNAPLTVGSVMTSTPINATIVSGTITEITELDIE